VADVEVDPSGRIYVLDTFAKEVRVFERNGMFLRSLGRAGSGPGEFTAPTALHLASGGRLWVLDARSGRFSVFDTTGAYLGDVSRIGAGRTQVLPWAGGIDSLERVHEYHPNREAFEANLTEIVTYTAIIGTRLRPVTTRQLPHRRTNELPAPWLGPNASIFLPYAPYRVWQTDAGGDIWYGFTDNYTIWRMDLDGHTKVAFSRDLEPAEVKAKEKQREIRRITAEMARARIEPSQIPDAKPLFSGFVVTSDGYLVVGRTLVEDAKAVGDTFMLDVFSPSGAFLGEVISPVPIGVRTWPSKIRGNYVVGIVKDDDDVDWVRLAWIERQ
jgi:hypothetical protein